MLNANLESKIAALAQSLGLEIYNIAMLKENTKDVLRVSISKAGESPKERAVSLEECEKLSHLLSPMLDVEMGEFDNYLLEVSSPGIERSINSLREFELSLGERVILSLKDKSKIVGILESVGADCVLVDGNRVAMSEVKKARTIFEF